MVFFEGAVSELDVDCVMTDDKNKKQSESHVVALPLVWKKLVVFANLLSNYYWTRLENGFISLKR